MVLLSLADGLGSKLAPHPYVAFRKMTLRQSDAAAKRIETGTTARALLVPAIGFALGAFAEV